MALGVGGDLPLLKSVDARCPVFSSGRVKAETVRGEDREQTLGRCLCVL